MMKFVFYTNSVSAHQLPLARELVARLGEAGYRYVYTGDSLQGGSQEVAAREPWIVRESSSVEVDQWLESAEVLMTGGLRPIDLIERRAVKGLRTFYYTERWFKPIEISMGRWGLRGHIHLPGKLRMLVPGYRKMARRFVNWLKSDSNARCLAIGPWAKKDMMWLGVPEEKIVDWGYFVERGSRCVAPDNRERKPKCEEPVKILWVGRMLDWKRVDTIVRAVACVNRKTVEVEGGGGQWNEASDRAGVSGKGKKVEGGRWNCTLTIVGDGPEKGKLLRLVDKLSANACIQFLPPVPIAEVRALMRAHDVYILSSNSQEGWGAVLNEAMEEGMLCLGTYEAGASAALLPTSNLFHAGDWRALAKLLAAIASPAPRLAQRRELATEYTPSGAADRLVAFMDGDMRDMGVSSNS